MAEACAYPVPESARCVLIFGGTFDPPHRAHIDLPIAARDAIGADWLLYVPAGRSPLKRENPIASDDDRVAMLRGVLRALERASVSTIELETGSAGESDLRPPSYTVDTLARLHEFAPPATRFRLLIGADQAVEFHRWREADRIVELAEPAVMLRPPLDSDAAFRDSLRAHRPEPQVERWARRVVALPVSPTSATDVRELLRRGNLDDPRVCEVIPEPVLDVIRSRRLYRQ